MIKLFQYIIQISFITYSVLSNYMKLRISIFIIITLLFISQITHQQQHNNIPTKSQPTDKTQVTPPPSASNQQALQQNLINPTTTQQIKLKPQNKILSQQHQDDHSKAKQNDAEKKQQQHTLNLNNLLHKAKQLGILNHPDIDNIKDKLNKNLQEMNPDQRNGYILELTKNMAEAYVNYQKIYEQEDKKQQEQLAHYQVDEPIQSEQSEQSEDEKIVTKTQEYKQKQGNKAKQYFKHNKQNFQGSSKSYSFTLETKSIADFRIEVATNQKIVMSVHLYIKNQGVYSSQNSAEDSQALETLVYQNKHKLIYQNKYYFQDLISFDAKTNSSYLLHFNNPGKHRFIFLTIKYILESHHFNQTLSSQHGLNYQSRIESMSSRFRQKLQESQARITLQDKNQEALLYKLAHYYYFSILQIIFIGVLCIIQVECIRKMLNNSTVI